MKNCVICGNEFKSNYKTKKTCSKECRIMRKNQMNRIQSKVYYQESKKPKHVNSFLLAKL